MYATHYGVSAQEARRRFALQDAAGDLNAQLSSKESATFAGLWLEHKPKFRVVVRFAGVTKNNVAFYTQNTELASIVEVGTAKVAWVDLKKAQMAAISSFAATGMRFESSINVQENRVEMYVLAGDRLNATTQMQTAQLPPFVVVITVSSMSQPQAEIYGGLAIRGQNGNCTTGFSVKNSSGVKGVTTAGHCNDIQVATFTGQGQFLAFKGEKYGGPYEVQWHTLAGYTPVNKVKMSASGATRVITATRGYSNQVIGAYLCKYGITTLYTCGTIVAKDDLPSYQAPYPKPNPPFTATFIRVKANSGYYPLSAGGDSGGPWFLGNTAYGTHITGNGYYASYMAINYVSGLGVSVMTAPYPATPPP